MNNKIIIGLTGRFGAGCSATAQLLEVGNQFKRNGLSTVLKDLAKEDNKFLKLPEKYKRNYLQNLGDELRNKNGQEYIAKIIIDKLREENDSRNIVIDGFKNPAEVCLFREEFSNFYLFAIDAETEARRERTKEIYDKDLECFRIDDVRDEGTDERPFSGQQVKVCMRIADILVNSDDQFVFEDGTKNNQAIEEYGQKINGYLKLIEKPGSRTPSLDEMFMHIACSVSLRSCCLKRQVGAIIVKKGKSLNEGNYILSTGCNNVPYGEKSCIICYRDEKKQDSIDKINFCSNCGQENISKNSTCSKCGEKLLNNYPGKLLDICRAVHAEEEAILQAAKLGISISGTTLYTSTDPCLLCSKKIINSGISDIIYLESYPMVQALEMLENCNVKRRKFEGVTSRVYNRLFLKDIAIN